MNSTTLALVVVGGTLAAIVLLNITIIAAFRNRKNIDLSHYRALGHMVNQIRNPRKQENQQLSELSELVKAHKDERQEKTE